MGAAGVRARWPREWLAIGAGTGLLVLGLVLVAAGEGFQVLPGDIAGPSRPNAVLWLLLGLVTFVAMPPAVSWASGRPGGPLFGVVALVGGIALALLVVNALPAVFDSATMVATLVIGVAGGVALRHEHRVELAGRAIAVVVLVAGSWVLTRTGLFDPLPLCTLAGLGVADWLTARTLRLPSRAGP